MVARVWRGAVRAADADEYADYIRATGFNAYAETRGNRGAWLLQREKGDLVEFVTYSLWDSYDAVRAFAGEDIETAVYYPDDNRFLVERDDTVAHYEVADALSGPAG